jgi:hypothetical protein
MVRMAAFATASSLSDRSSCTAQKLYDSLRAHCNFLFGLRASTASLVLLVTVRMALWKHAVNCNPLYR